MTMGTSKRPDTASGPSGFAEEHKREKMAEFHNQQLTVEEQCAYEAKAAEKDMACKTLPERSENLKCVDSRLLSAKVNPHHRNQQDIVSGVVKALSNLIGWNWGQYGEAAFFVQGAFRNADNELKTFK